MEGDIHFDASKYPRYQEGVGEHLGLMRRVFYLSLAGDAFIGVFIAVFLSQYSFSLEITLLFALLFFGMTAFFVLFTPFITKKLRSDYEHKPLRITDRGIEFMGIVTPFEKFDRVVNSEVVIRSANPGFVSLANGKKAVRSFKIKLLGDPGEFARVLKQLHPEVRIELK